MASPNVYSSGIGGTAGSPLALVPRLLCSGSIWYVKASTGSDAATPRGKERIRPLATLAQAITNSAAGDIIVLLEGHTESLSAAQTIATAGLLILGEGSGISRPHFTRTGDVNMFDITGAGVELNNISFNASTTTISTKSRVRFAAANSRVVGCYFACGPTYDTGPALEFVTGSSQVCVKSTYFVSTSTDVTLQPESAIKVTNAVTDFQLGGEDSAEGVVFDGGSSGWSNPYAFNGAAALTRFRAINVDLLGDSDMTLATGSSYVINIRNTSGSARVVCAA